MKTWPDRKSPWGKQIRFDDAEFEAMMDDLRFRSGEHFAPGKGVDVDRVLMSGVGVEADYVELPFGTLGRTRFKSDGGVVIQIDRRLADDAETDTVSRRRLRTTLAHECGHFACHSTLFIGDTETLALFPQDDAATRAEPILCRTTSVEAGPRAYNGEWWEHQANRCMAALLMPRGLFGEAARRLVKASGHPSFAEAIAGGSGEELVEVLANEFDVSLTATFYRLQALEFVPRDAQPMLQM